MAAFKTPAYCDAVDSSLNLNYNYNNMVLLGKFARGLAGLSEKLEDSIERFSDKLQDGIEHISDKIEDGVTDFVDNLYGDDNSANAFILNRRTKVIELKRQFHERFGSVLRIYVGRSQVDDNMPLKDVGLTKEGAFECLGNMQVGTFITRMAENYGLKVKVYTSDEWVAVLDDLTLAASGRVKKNATKADMEAMLGGTPAVTAPTPKIPVYEVKTDRFVITKNSDGSYSVVIDGKICPNSKEGMRIIAEALGFDYDHNWTTHQFGSKLSKFIETIKAPMAVTPDEKEFEIEDEEFEDAEDPIGEYEYDNVSYDIFSDCAFAQYLVEDAASEKLVIPDAVTFEGKEYPVSYWGAGDDGVKVVELGKNVKWVDALHAGCGSLEKLIIHSPKGFIEWENEDGDPVSSAEECFPGVEITYVTAPSIK